MARSRLLFLSTLSLRRATVEEVSGDTWARDFYPRSPCGERPVNVQSPTAENDFYPRSPCGERRATKSDQGANNQFLSTLSLRRATSRRYPVILGRGISIHALLAESDRKKKRSSGSFPDYFYPRSPCGERHIARARRASIDRISIHALLAESDVADHEAFLGDFKFLSTLSLRRATAERYRNAYDYLFLSTLSLRRATITVSNRQIPHINFYPRSPCGERLRLRARYRRSHRISIHALLAESDH